MMNSLKKYKMPIIIVVVLILVFIIYSYFKGDSSQSDALVTTTGNPTAGQPGVGEDFINQLLTLERVSLDISVFSDPKFQSLEDFSQPIPDQAQGRPNPFAPIGVDTVNSPTVGSPQGGAGFTFQSSTSSPNSANPNPNQ